MALATLASLASAWGTAAAMHASITVCMQAFIALAIGSILTFGPVLLRIGSEHFGVAVLFCGAARGLVSLAAAYFIADQHPNDPHRSLYMGVAAGAIFLLIVETLLTINILSAIERRRVAQKAGAAVPSPQA